MRYIEISGKSQQREIDVKRNEFIMRKDGKKSHIEFSVYDILHEVRPADLQVIQGVDITEKKLAEEKLRQKIIELNSFINNIPDMAWLKDADSRFIAVNKAFGEAVRMDQESLIGHSCEVCFGKEEAKKFREDDQKVMKSRRQEINEEKIIDSQKNDVWLETIKSPIINESGKVVGTVGIVRNITERKKANEIQRPVLFWM